MSDLPDTLEEAAAGAASAASAIGSAAFSAVCAAASWESSSSSDESAMAIADERQVQGQSATISRRRQTDRTFPIPARTRPRYDEPPPHPATTDHQRNSYTYERFEGLRSFPVPALFQSVPNSLPLEQCSGMFRTDPIFCSGKLSVVVARWRVVGGPVHVAPQESRDVQG